MELKKIKIKKQTVMGEIRDLRQTIYHHSSHSTNSQNETAQEVDRLKLCNMNLQQYFHLQHLTDNTIQYNTIQYNTIITFAERYLRRVQER